MNNRWRDGIVTMHLVSGTTLVFDGGARTVVDSTGAIIDYDVRGGTEWLVFPHIDRVDAISVTPPEVSE